MFQKLSNVSEDLDSHVNHFKCAFYCALCQPLFTFILKIVAKYIYKK